MKPNEHQRLFKSVGTPSTNYYSRQSLEPTLDQTLTIYSRENMGTACQSLLDQITWTVLSPPHFLLQHSCSLSNNILVELILAGWVNAAPFLNR